jgi:hypothetical protein
MGARPLNRVIQTHLQDPLAEDIISGKIKQGDTVHVLASDDKLVLRINEMPDDTEPSSRCMDKNRNIDSHNENSSDTDI